jgi:hypothetical protein
MTFASGRAWRILLLGGVAVASLVIGASAGHAALTGPCEASGTLVKDGPTYNAKSLPGVVEIPRKDSVRWTGSVTPTVKEMPRPVKGEVVVHFPPPIGDVTVGSWGDQSSKVENADTYVYDVPSVIAGVEIPISGSHTEQGVTCKGSAVVKVRGTSPVAWASLAFTVVSLVGVGLSITAKPR